jgi:hypothetical protein
MGTERHYEEGGSLDKKPTGGRREKRQAKARKEGTVRTKEESREDTEGV